MSVVVWDGMTLAADKQATDCDMRSIATKIKKLEDGRVVAWVGGYNTGRALAEWYENGADPKSWPSSQNGGDEGAKLIVVYPDGKCQEYANCPSSIPNEIIEPFMAWGSGRDYAMGAMAMGATAIEAVVIANQFCITCGGGVDSFIVGEQSYHPKPLEWFVERIGRRVFRDQPKYCCPHCEDVARDGLVISDGLHADYMATIDRDFACEGIFMNYRDDK